MPEDKSVKHGDQDGRRARRRTTFQEVCSTGAVVSALRVATGLHDRTFWRESVVGVAERNMQNICCNTGAVLCWRGVQGICVIDGRTESGS